MKYILILILIAANSQASSQHNYDGKKSISVIVRSKTIEKENPFSVILSLEVGTNRKHGLLTRIERLSKSRGLEIKVISDNNSTPISNMIIRVSGSKKKVLRVVSGIR